MEREPKMGGIIFGSKDYMSVIRNDNEQISRNKSSNHDSDTILGISYSHWLHNLQTYCRKVLNQKRMAEIKFGWVMMHMLGIPVYILGIVDNLDNYKSAVLFFMGLVYSSTVIYRSYQKGRKERIANDREEFHLLLEKEKSGHQKHKHA